MNVLVACEFSGVVRDAFRLFGHNAVSCDLLPSERPGPHLQGDVRQFLGYGWDLLVAHPPCTYLANSGVRWLYGGKGTTPDPARWQSMAEGARFFAAMLNAPIPMIAVENPVMHKYGVGIIGRPCDQVIQPWQFGHREMKATCLWLKGLPLLQPTDIVGPPPSDPMARRDWAKVHRASPGPDRWKERSRTYTGFALAMAQQWGSLLRRAA